MQDDEVFGLWDEDDLYLNFYVTLLRSFSSNHCLYKGVSVHLNTSTLVTRALTCPKLIMPLLTRAAGKRAYLSAPHLPP